MSRRPSTREGRGQARPSVVRHVAFSQELDEHPSNRACPGRPRRARACPGRPRRAAEKRAETGTVKLKIRFEDFFQGGDVFIAERTLCSSS